MATTSLTTNNAKTNSSAILQHLIEISKIQEAQESEDAVKRYALYPVLDPEAFMFYMAQEATHWSDTELDFLADVKDYKAADPRIVAMINAIMAFFLVGDGVISKNILVRFLLECNTFEEQSMFISQLHIELVHAATYGLAAITFCNNNNDLVSLLASVEVEPAIIRKLNFMEKYLLADIPKFDRLVAFCCAEGIFFCSIFPAIFFLRTRGIFTNFVYANEFIRKDEYLHRSYGILLAVRDRKKVTDLEELKAMRTRAIAIVTEAVSISEQFMNFMLPNAIEDLSKENMNLYVRLMADSILLDLGYTAMFAGVNPFSWHEDISLEQKSNFHERYVANYTKRPLKELLDWQQRAGISSNTVKADVYNNPEDVDV